MPQLPLLPQDKANHLFYGAMICLAVSLAVMLLLPMYHPTKIGFMAAAVVGILKEGLDKILNVRAVARGEPPPHGVEFYDFLATAVGGAIPHFGWVLGSSLFL